MLSSVSTKQWLVISILISGSLLLGALFFEHVMRLTPCQMCYWQRHAHKAVILTASIFLVFNHFMKTPKWDRIILFVVGIAFLVSFGMAFWHMGVEYKWWLGPKSCSASTPTQINPDAIFNALEGKDKLPQCSDAPWDLFGISMAGYNALISGGAAIASFARALKGNENVTPS